MATASCSQKQLVLQLRKIARDPKQCEALVRNPRCVESLVQTLDSPDDETRLITIQTLLMICNTPSGIPALRKLASFEQKLDLLQDSPHQQISKYSKHLFAKIYPNVRRASAAVTQNNNHCMQSPKMPSTRSSRTQQQPNRQHLNKRPASGFTNNKDWQKNKKQRKVAKVMTIKLEILNLDKCESERLEKVAMKYEGVIRLNVDQDQTSFYVQQDLDKHDFAQFLKEEGFQVKLPRKPTLTQRPRNQMQRYQPNRAKGNQGKPLESLSERLARQRREAEKAKQEQEAESKQAEGWLSGAASYFW